MLVIGAILALKQAAFAEFSPNPLTEFCMLLVVFNEQIHHARLGTGHA
jgi:hypothetical protein